MPVGQHRRMGGDVGGYRRIRLLSPDPDDEVCLARAVDAAEDEPVVVRLTSGDRAEAELAAVGALSSPHVIGLSDLFSLPDGRVGLVFPRLPGGSLAELLDRRADLTAGEAATLLISVARGLAALHEAGRSHGRLRPARVLFDRSGTPVLTGMTRSAPLDPAGRQADERDLAKLAVAVLSRVPDAGPALTTLSAHAPAVAPEDLERMAFDFADPEPIDLSGEPSAPGSRSLRSPMPGRVVAPRASPGAEAGPRHRGDSVPRPAAGLRGAVSAGVGRARRAVSGVRRRTLVLAGGSAVALLLALVFVPAGADGPARGDDAAPSSSTPVSRQSLSPLDTAPLTADDPLDAALVLAGRRDECLGTGSAECLGEVDQPASALLAGDQQAIAMGAAGGSQTLPASDAKPFVQRTGDTALVSVDSTTLLLVRIDGQWRLRDVFAAEAPSD